MKQGYEISNRGTYDCNAIVVINWEVLNEVDNVRVFNLNTAIIPKQTVAIFKIKWKQ